MALPRSRYVKEGQEGVYHCFTRCVRRAFLYGVDAVTGRDYSHRKKWLVDRLRHLASIFAIDVCAYAVMDNHYHAILRMRPDIMRAWSNREVATRWLTLYPPHRAPDGSPMPPTEAEISALADTKQRIAILRQRLCSLSWFMGRLNEFIARAANKEDGVKGRFWESRFKCRALLDLAAIASCMVYVDLNLIQAGLAPTPETSDFTSIQERIRAWQRETMTTPPAPNDPEHQPQSDCFDRDIRMSDTAGGIPTAALEQLPAMGVAFIGADIPGSWLCPIQSDAQHRGILDMTAAEYFELVDQSGRLIRSDKRGHIDPKLAPILLRIGANPKAWRDTVSTFGSIFHLAAGLPSSMRRFADQLGNKYLKGIGNARIAFASSPPPSA